MTTVLKPRIQSTKPTMNLSKYRILKGLAIWFVLTIALIGVTAATAALGYWVTK